MKVVLYLAVIGLAWAGEERNRECKLPTKDDTDCNHLIVDCEDQLEEAYVSRGNKITCLDINTMDKELFFEATESCNVLSKCKCTAAYYLHCKYDPDEFNFAPPPNESPCFAGDTMVDTDAGSMNLRTLLNRKDAQVKVVDDQNQITFSPVLTWLHAEERESGFHDIVAGERRLSLTSEHILYTVPCEGGSRTGKFAREVRIGECVLVEQDGALVPTPISQIDRSTKTGIYTPITNTGTIVADGIAASNYAYTKYEKLAHWGFTTYLRMSSPVEGQHGIVASYFSFRSVF